MGHDHPGFIAVRDCGDKVKKGCRKRPCMNSRSTRPWKSAIRNSARYLAAVPLDCWSASFFFFRRLAQRTNRSSSSIEQPVALEFDICRLDSFDTFHHRVECQVAAHGRQRQQALHLRGFQVCPHPFMPHSCRYSISDWPSTSATSFSSSGQCFYIPYGITSSNTRKD